jgi:hypothetical protein
MRMKTRKEEHLKARHILTYSGGSAFSTAGNAACMAPTPAPPMVFLARWNLAFVRIGDDVNFNRVDHDSETNAQIL